MALSALLIGQPSPQTTAKPASKTSRPRRQDAQLNHLDILSIFVKQRTYLPRPVPAEPLNHEKTQNYQILQS